MVTTLSVAFSEIVLLLPDYNYFSKLPKNTPTHRCPASGLNLDLGLNAGALLQLSDGSFLKYHLHILIFLLNSSKYFGRSASFIKLGVGTNPKPLFKTFITVSVKNVWLKLETVPA